MTCSWQGRFQSHSAPDPFAGQGTQTVSSLAIPPYHTGPCRGTAMPLCHMSFGPICSCLLMYLAYHFPMARSNSPSLSIQLHLVRLCESCEVTVPPGSEAANFGGAIIAIVRASAPSPATVRVRSFKCFHLDRRLATIWKVRLLETVHHASPNGSSPGRHGGHGVKGYVRSKACPSAAKT